MEAIAKLKTNYCRYWAFRGSFCASESTHVYTIDLVVGLLVTGAWVLLCATGALEVGWIEFDTVVETEPTTRKRASQIGGNDLHDFACTRERRRDGVEAGSFCVI